MSALDDKEVSVPHTTPIETHVAPTAPEHGSENGSEDEIPLEVEKTRSQAEGASLRQVPTAGERKMGAVKWVSICIGLYLTAFLYGLDTTIAADVQASILSSFGDISKLSWVGVGFPMGSAATILLIGKLFGTFDIKWIYLASIILFEVGSAVCGAAPNMNALIVGRVIAGIGGAGMYLGCLNYIAVFTTPAEAAIYNGLCGVFWGLGTILGPVIGGAFASSGATWRWAFYINLVLAAVTAPVYIFWFPRFNPQKDTLASQKVKQIDWVGAVLNAGSFILFIVVLSYAGVQWQWSSPGTIVLWVLFGVVFIAYILQQVFCIFTTPQNRMFPVQLATQRTTIFAYVATSAGGSGIFVALYYIPLFFQFTRGDSAIEAAVRLLPFVFVMITFVMLAGGLLPEFGRYAPFYLVGGVLLVIGSALMMTIDPANSAATIYGFEVLMAAGAGLACQIGYSIGMAAVPPMQIPDAVGFINLAQIGGIVICLSISGSIFQNRGFINIEQALAGYNIPSDEIRSALAGTRSVLLEHGNEKIHNLVIGAIVKTISTIFALSVVAGGLLIVCAIVMKWEKLNLKPPKDVSKA